MSSMLWTNARFVAIGQKAKHLARNATEQVKSNVKTVTVLGILSIVAVVLSILSIKCKVQLGNLDLCSTIKLILEQPETIEIETEIETKKCYCEENVYEGDISLLHVRSITDLALNNRKYELYRRFLTHFKDNQKLKDTTTITVTKQHQVLYKNYKNRPYIFISELSIQSFLVYDVRKELFTSILLTEIFDKSKISTDEKHRFNFEISNDHVFMQYGDHVARFRLDNGKLNKKIDFFELPIKDKLDRKIGDLKYNRNKTVFMVADIENELLYLLNSSTLSLIDEIKVPCKPHSIEVHNDQIYIGCSGNRVHTVASNEPFIRDVCPNNDEVINDIKVYNNERLLIPCYSSNLIRVYNLNGVQGKDIKLNAKPRSITWNERGHLYVVGDGFHTYDMCCTNMTVNDFYTFSSV